MGLDPKNSAFGLTCATGLNHSLLRASPARRAGLAACPPSSFPALCLKAQASDMLGPGENSKGS